MKTVPPQCGEYYTRGDKKTHSREEAPMTVYCGVDFHARQQTIAFCNTQNGEIKFIQLKHDDRDALRRFYLQFQAPVIVGLEAGGYRVNSFSFSYRD